MKFEFTIEFGLQAFNFSFYSIGFVFYNTNLISCKTLGL
ncbi:hypothetical protein BVAVS116_H0036 (plasmid) [Borreliella valaisiana VS116]|uniref:Uncharacterized protein n=1 Tax=Borreliella valaisiana VS116 TaxID=445987 RepID=C0R993_BORVA|nr:hypothetical protein BVAVS116_H0036 [Borreliella valaisiana VS116]